MLLPREVYKKMPRGRLLVENVIEIYMKGMESDRGTTVKGLGTL